MSSLRSRNAFETFDLRSYSEEDEMAQKVRDLVTLINQLLLHNALVLKPATLRLILRPDNFNFFNLPEATRNYYIETLAKIGKTIRAGASEADIAIIETHISQATHHLSAYLDTLRAIPATKELQDSEKEAFAAAKQAVFPYLDLIQLFERIQKIDTKALSADEIKSFQMLNETLLEALAGENPKQAFTEICNTYKLQKLIQTANYRPPSWAPVNIHIVPTVSPDKKAELNLIAFFHLTELHGHIQRIHADNLTDSRQKALVSELKARVFDAFNEDDTSTAYRNLSDKFKLYEYAQSILSIPENNDADILVAYLRKLKKFAFDIALKNSDLTGQFKDLIQQHTDYLRLKSNLPHKFAKRSTALLREDSHSERSKLHRQLLHVIYAAYTAEQTPSADTKQKVEEAYNFFVLWKLFDTTITNNAVRYPCLAAKAAVQETITDVCLNNFLKGYTKLLGAIKKQTENEETLNYTFGLFHTHPKEKALYEGICSEAEAELKQAHPVLFIKL
jgi:hypothetical protein